jgi:hypothetical protein
MAEPEEPPNIQGRTFNEPYSPEQDVRIRPTTTLQQPAFSLTGEDWAYLKLGEPKIFWWARTLLIAGTVSALQLLGKVITVLFSPGMTFTVAGFTNAAAGVISTWEYVTPVVVLVASGLLYAIGAWCKNPKRRVSREIEDYFDKNRPTTKQK